MDMDAGKKRPVRLTPPTYAPSLVFLHGKRERDQVFCTLSDRCCHDRSVREMRGMKCVASCYGWLILKSFYSNQCYLFDPVSVTNIHLPPLIHKSFEVGVLTCHPSNPNCVVLFVSNAKKSFIYCRIGDNKWIERKLVWRENSRKVVPYGDVSVTSCEEKIYMFFINGMVVIDVRDTPASVCILKVERCEFSIPDYLAHTNYYVESCGEIFRVCLLHLGSTNLIQSVEVFKLDFSRMCWAKVENVGNQIFLLGPSCGTLVSATDLGVKGSCIYFTREEYKSLYRFDMDDGSITVTLPCSKKFSHWVQPFWMVPHCKVQEKKDLAKVEKARDGGHMTSNWNELPLELLELILSCLFLGDCIRFRLTCKTWISINQPIRSYPQLILSNSGSQQIPWLLSFSKKTKGACKFYHPIFSYAYTMNIPDLEGMIVRHANFGWLLLSKGNRSIFFFNPTTMETIKLPDYKSADVNCYMFEFVNISFSSPPTSSDCMVFGHFESHIYSVQMSVYMKQQDTWFDFIYKSKVPCDFMASHCNPVFYEGVFYCLGKNGKVGIFDPREEDYKEVWKVLPVQAVLSFKNIENHMTSVKSFLVEYGGEILSFFVPVNKPITAFKLDLSEKKWVRVESLGDKVAFLSHTTSMLVPAGVKGIENRIYLPKFHGQDIMYYSLSTGSYSYFGKKDPCANWIDSSEIFDCTWLQVNV